MDVYIAIPKQNSPSYTGRDEGKRVRREMHLDVFDRLASRIHIIIPDEAYTISTSFFIGCFGESVHYHGGAEAFRETYKFVGQYPYLVDVLKGHARIAEMYYEETMRE